MADFALDVLKAKAEAERDALFDRARNGWVAANTAQDDLRAARLHVSRLRALLARAGEALAPFAVHADALDADFFDHQDDIVACGLPESPCLFGDFRTARTVAAKIEEALR